MKGAGRGLLIIIVLSLAVWVLFDSYSKQPDRDETVVIVLICTLLVLAGRWLRERIQKIWRRGEHGP